jgi:S-phase kinase-associated protein 1
MADDEQVTLQSYDGQEFTVLLKAAKMSDTIKNLIEDAGTDGVIPLPNVTGKILQKVIEYCMHHVNDPVAAVKEDAATAAAAGDEPLIKVPKVKRTDDISSWDQEFCNVDLRTKVELTLAANYLDIKPLLELTCKAFANMIKGKTPEEIRKTFNIREAPTPEQEEQVREENKVWVQEDQ